MLDIEAPQSQRSESGLLDIQRVLLDRSEPFRRDADKPGAIDFIEVGIGRLKRNAVFETHSA